MMKISPGCNECGEKFPVQLCAGFRMWEHETGAMWPESTNIVSQRWIFQLSHSFERGYYKGSYPMISVNITDVLFFIPYNVTGNVLTKSNGFKDYICVLK